MFPSRANLGAALGTKYSRLFFQIKSVWNNYNVKPYRVLVFGVDDHDRFLVRHTDLWNASIEQCMLGSPTPLGESRFAITAYMAKEPGDRGNYTKSPVEHQRDRRKLIVLARKYGRRLQQELEAAREKTVVEPDNHLGYAAGHKYYTPEVADILRSISRGRGALCIHSGDPLDKQLKAIYNRPARKRKLSKPAAPPKEKKVAAGETITMYLLGSPEAMKSIAAGEVCGNYALIASTTPLKSPYRFATVWKMRYAVQVHRKDILHVEGHIATLKRGAEILGYATLNPENF